MNTIHNPAYAHVLPEDIRENTRRRRTFAEIVNNLGREHDAHVARIDALLKENGK